MGMKLEGITSEFKVLSRRAKELSLVNDRKIVGSLLSELEDKTPVDTGHAKASWGLESSSDGFKVSNSAEYIEYLNNGSSKQAPAFFVESTALKYGTPLGAIVEPR